MDDFLPILRRNIFTPIVLAIFSLSITLLALGERRDAMFISSVITLNVVIAIIQEIRARQALKKLELLSAPKARKRFADGTHENIDYHDLAPGDIIELVSGDEVPADGIIYESRGLEIDESMLSGESVAIEKHDDDIGYATTTVASGSALMRISATGVDTRAGNMTSELRRYEPKYTPLQLVIQRTISVTTYAALLVAATIFVVYYFQDQEAVRIFKTITSAAVTLVPEGLLLASSLLLAFGSLKLARVNMLPQKTSAIESMALLNVLAVDKTGTLTEPNLTLNSIEVLGSSLKKADFSDMVAIIAREASGKNATGLAITNQLPTPSFDYEIKDVLAFSSDRKYSAVKYVVSGKTKIVIMGAPEVIADFATFSPKDTKKIDRLTESGLRVLAVAISENAFAKRSLKSLEKGASTLVGIVVLGNELREGVEKTVEYLQSRGVKVKVISGDNPKTVSYVAKKAGISGYTQVITGAELDKLSASNWRRAVKDNTIFARVLPDQKEKIISLYQRGHNFTGMVGDGVNDALALKKADLGIAMFAGASVSRRVADMILLNNSFTTLPLGMRLGNRLMQAIEIIATLFFHRIIYSLVLLVLTTVFGAVYPFEPRHVTFMNIFLVTMPTIMWTLFPPLPKHRINPRFFWRDTLFAVAGIAAISGLVVSASYAILTNLHPNFLHGVATTTVIIATFFGVYLVFLVPRMLGVKHTRTARLSQVLYILCVIFVVIVSFGFGVTRDFFDFTTPAWRNVWPLSMLIILAAYLQWRLASRAGENLTRRSSRALGRKH